MFTCKTPTAGWINLAQIRQLQDEELHGHAVVIITWHKGDHDQQAFKGVDATAIIETWEQAATLLEQRCNFNFRLLNIHICAST